MRSILAGAVAPLVLLACTQADTIAHGKSAHVEHVVAVPANVTNETVTEAPTKAEPEHDVALEWLRGKLPQGGSADRDAQGKLVVTHKSGPKDDAFALAKAYLDVSSTYMLGDLANHIAKTNGFIAPGKTVTIPDVLQAEPYRSPEAERLPVGRKTRPSAPSYFGGHDATPNMGVDARPPEGPRHERHHSRWQGLHG